MQYVLKDTEPPDYYSFYERRLQMLLIHVILKCSNPIQYDLAIVVLSSECAETDQKKGALGLPITDFVIFRKSLEPVFLSMK